MIMSVRFCLSYDLLNAKLSPSKLVYFNESLHCCNKHHHDVNCSLQKCYVTCGHIIIYDMTLSNEHHMINYDMINFGRCSKISNTIIISFLPKRSRQTEQIHIILLMKKKSDQDLPCLLFYGAFCEFLP